MYTKHGLFPAVLLIRGRRVQPDRLPVKNRLRILRAERDWSQAELAARLEVSRQTVNAIETGRYDPSLPLAFAIAKIFGKLIEEVFEPEEN
jgi:putative transcriptional regulator